jgi:hypothetical protein
LPAPAPRPVESELVAPTHPAVIANDPVVQTRAGTAPTPVAGQDFNGLCLGEDGGPCPAELSSECGCLPPDPVGEAGPTQYVQAVNNSFAVFSKTGTILKGATPFNTLWSQVPNDICFSTGNSDPIVLYDQLANRWILSELVATQLGAASNGECIAVSTTGDATGTYYLYSFDFGTTLLDYPHFGVWPDAYYMTANEFPPNQQLSQGVAAVAFERQKMLNGQVARLVMFDEGQFSPPGSTFYAGQLPTDLDGSTTPPAGEPNFFMEVDDPQSLPAPPGGLAGFNMRIWKFHVDWTNTANSTFGTGATHLPDSTLGVAAMTRFQCVYGHPVPTCIPQKAEVTGLDALDDRLMFRLAYRNFGDHEALTVAMTAAFPDAGAPTGYRYGVRWYEVRSPNGAVVLTQQGTYAPADTPTNLIWRWMGSAAMDHSGDLALAYSASGPNDYPSIRYAGRAPGDPLGQITSAETTLPAPYSGPEHDLTIPIPAGRWGDYSDLTVDPADDCTFWYTQEWLDSDFTIMGTSLEGVWRTRIGSFKFSQCQGGTTAVATRSFGSRWTKGHVALTWRTGSETKLLGFNVWRSSGKSWRLVNPTMVPAKHSGTVHGGVYRLVDRTARPGRFFTYRLQTVDPTGKPAWFGVGSVPIR